MLNVVNSPLFHFVAFYDLFILTLQPFAYNVTHSSVLFSGSCRAFWASQLHLKLFWSLCSADFLVLWQGPSIGIFFSLSFIFTVVNGCGKSTRRQILSVLFIKTWFKLLAVVRWSVCVSKLKTISWVSFSCTDSCLCIYHVLVWSTFIHLLFPFLFPSFYCFSVWFYAANTVTGSRD